MDDAAKFSAETMRHDGRDNQQKGSTDDIQKLRNDVLKQATASLAAFIGDIRYSDSFHISAAGSNVVQVKCYQLVFGVLVSNVCHTLVFGAWCR